MHYDSIKGFQVDGVISGDSFVTTRERLLHEIEVQMRDEGYVPHLDLNPITTREYVSEGNFDFKITVYGVYIGEEKSLSVAGVTDGKEIPKGKSILLTK